MYEIPFFNNFDTGGNINTQRVGGWKSQACENYVKGKNNLEMNSRMLTDETVYEAVQLKMFLIMYAEKKEKVGNEKLLFLSCVTIDV